MSNLSFDLLVLESSCDLRLYHVDVYLLLFRIKTLEINKQSLVKMETTKHIFTYNEKKCLRDIVKKYYAIVENKDIHTEAVRQKNATWQQIGEEYNACPHVSFHATPKQLRRLWLNLKQRSKAKPQTLILKKEPEQNGTQNEDPLRVELLEKGINELQTFNYRDQQEECRKIEKHEIEMHILKERLREAKAKADLAELIYNQQFNKSEIEQTNYK